MVYAVSLEGPLFGLMKNIKGRYMDEKVDRRARYLLRNGLLPTSPATMVCQIVRHVLYLSDPMDFRMSTSVPESFSNPDFALL
jgi:hypothetical protein